MWLRTGTALPLMLLTLPAAAQRHALPTHMAAPADEPAIAAVASEQPIRFGLTLPLRNVDALQALIRDQRDPASPRYRQWLSAEQFTAAYGPTEADYNRVIAFARAQGFTVTHTFANRLLLDVSGTPASIEKAFAVRMQMHARTASAGKYYAPDGEPTVAESVPILSIEGLSSREQPHPMLVHSPAGARPQLTTGSGPGGYFLGSDMRAAYAGDTPFAGAGQTVGLIELGPYNRSDVTAYFNAIKQPLSVPIYDVLLGVDGVCAGTPASGGCDDGEEVIDIQQAISMAPALSGLIVYESYNTGDFLSPFAQAASDNVAKQLSLSFGFGGTPATQPGYEQIFMEFAAQGQNLFIASGDGGAFPNGGGYPGNSPNVVDVGGTDLVTAGAGGPWQNETAWIGSGGGFNPDSPIPAYQTRAITAANGGSKTYRNVPDVSMEANTDNFFCANGSCQNGVGGTSLAAPRWAGFLALANEQANGIPVGFLNPTIYALGHTSGYASFFHDITVGNTFNAASPNLFQAMPGYDLTSGWGTPNGQSALNAIAPPPAANAPNFSLLASPATLNLTPGAGATATVTLTPQGGFAGATDLRVTLIGAPAGVTATLDRNTLPGAGQAVLNIETTGATPGGSYLVAITGVNAGLSHTAYVSLALPDFSLASASPTIYLNQRGTARDIFSVNAVNGFTGAVTLTGGAPPPGVTGAFSPAVTTTASTLNLNGDVLAPTTAGRQVSVSGTSSGTTHTLPSLQLAVSAAAGQCGLGEPVDLSGSWNLTAIRPDGQSNTDGGLDGSGYTYSAALLGNARVLNGTKYLFGAPGIPNAIYGAGQTIPVQHGHYNALQLVGTGVGGSQASQTFIVHYTDGTTTQLSQGFSDWFSPGPNVNETEAVAMPYRNRAGGTRDNRQFNAYGYTLPLDGGKTVESLTLPKNRSLIVLAATLSVQQFGTEVDLARQFNATGITTDGTTFGDGLDGSGAAYSANLLGDTTAAGRDVYVGPSAIHLGGANVPDVVYGAGQTIALPSGYYQDLQLLGTAVQGDQTGQPLTVSYADGSVQTFNQSFSDWSALGSYVNESQAIRTAYRDYNDGSRNQQAFNVYLYTLPLNLTKPVKSITLPDNRYVVLLGMTLMPWSVFELEPVVCPYFGQ